MITAIETLKAWLHDLRAWFAAAEVHVPMSADQLEPKAGAEMHFLDGPVLEIGAEDAHDAIARLTAVRMPSVWFGPFVPTRRKLAEQQP